MTIDEAIRYADMLANDASTVWEIPMVEIQRLNALCAGALRAAKRMSDKTKGEPVVPEALETWQERMQCEYRETKERYEKLNRLLVKHAAGTLDFTLKCPIELLKAQREHMSDYLYTLEIRAEIEGVNLYD